MNGDLSGEVFLELAAEDFDSERFKKAHVFSDFEERIIRKLVAHGPVLIKGGRGSGKSALMREAENRLNEAPLNQTAFAVYLSLRHVPLLLSVGKAYELLFCQLLSKKIGQTLSERAHDLRFPVVSDVSQLQENLTELSRQLQRRIVLLFDDAAHIGRETSLSEFFDIFRTISSSSVSCKAAIYPGVTNFGTRFDVYNDATVVDLVRNEDSESFAPFFASVVERRYQGQLDKDNFASGLSLTEVAGFIGRAVIGNMRSFVFVFNRLADLIQDNPKATIGLPQLGNTLISVARDYYWPLIDEVKPKLGKYVPLIVPSTQLADKLYDAVGTAKNQTRSALVHRDHVEALQKLFEILEYTGFIMRRDASRGMKSGGRGTRFVMNLCNLLEKTPGSRLTRELFNKWNGPDSDPVEIHKTTDLGVSATDVLQGDVEPEILGKPISILAKSKAYPYGLTEHMLTQLQQAGIRTVGELAECDDDFIDDLPGIGEKKVKRIKNAVAYAVWM
jgi:hypothetical protein